jgi:hypothetical protein
MPTAPAFRSAIAVIALLACCALAAPAADAKKKKDEAVPDLPKVLMTTPGKVMLEEPFTAESWKKNWSAYKGDFQSVGDQLRVAERPEDGHHPEASHPGPVHNVIVRFKFKYDGCKWMGFSFTDKEHVARIMIQNDGFELVKMSGIGPTTKGQRLDHVNVKWDPAKWYTMTIELLGDELLASVDDQYVLFGEAPGMDIDKNRIALIVGGQYGWYDELKMWEALSDPKWAKRKPLVLAQKEKRK